MITDLERVFIETQKAKEWSSFAEFKAHYDIVYSGYAIAAYASVIANSKSYYSILLIA